ncbi:sensor histidine kinase [Leptospira perolatii]|uniref:histidine kinase n=1 Tax=Leptospira perolatii TaxID=2023191 RepID=A0A2M9ZM72_9LEPT|nr:HAMP domain-containing sensor histidine kinase [Leptospira perolatii]PJZ69162.1 sensor histidine kinase [Leptospira perolatii]PJZ73094.1 sensor histidine kinase [Leptospira perolatii]
MNSFLPTLRNRVRKFVKLLNRHLQLKKELRGNAEFILSAYYEVNEILIFIFPFLAIAMVPFTIIDILSYYSHHDNSAIILFDACFIAGCILFTFLLNFPSIRPSDLNRRKVLVTSATIFLTFCATTINVLLLKFGSDVSIFAFTQLGVAVLFRYPDKTKTFIYILNYGFFIYFLHSLDPKPWFLLQNITFIFVVTLLFDQISFLTKVSSFHKQQSIRELNRRLVLESVKKSEILRIAIHDLKSPVTGILSLVGLYTKEPPGADEKSSTNNKSEPPEVLDHIEQTARRILDSIEEVLYLSTSEETVPRKRQLQQIQPVELLRTVTANLGFSIQTKNIEIVDELPRSQFSFSTHPQILYRVFDNLLTNAVKFSPHGSTILLHGEILENHKGKILKINIEDSGPGFRPEDQEGIFREFSVLSAKPTGIESSTGVGLSLAKKLLDRMCVKIQLGNSTRLGGANVSLEFEQY